MKKVVAAWALALAGCSQKPAAEPPVENDHTAPTTPTTSDPRADCIAVLEYTWKLMDGDPDSPKRHHEPDIVECMEHITPAARDCVLAATNESQVNDCVALGK